VLSVSFIDVVSDETDAIAFLVERHSKLIQYSAADIGEGKRRGERDLKLGTLELTKADGRL
jgi:hypothetical protein